MVVHLIIHEIKVKSKKVFSKYYNMKLHCPTNHYWFHPAFRWASNWRMCPLGSCIWLVLDQQLYHTSHNDDRAHSVMVDSMCNDISYIWSVSWGDSCEGCAMTLGSYGEGVMTSGSYGEGVMTSGSYVEGVMTSGSYRERVPWHQVAMEKV